MFGGYTLVSDQPSQPPPPTLIICKCAELGSLAGNQDKNILVDPVRLLVCQDYRVMVWDVGISWELSLLTRNTLRSSSGLY